MTIKYIKWQPNVNKIYQHIQLQDPPKFTQIAIFGLKIHHLANLERSTFFGGKSVLERCRLEAMVRNL
jgi:hypothetical protein